MPIFVAEFHAEGSQEPEGGFKFIEIALGPPIRCVAVSVTIARKDDVSA
jgi:hypothetical protein